MAIEPLNTDEKLDTKSKKAPDMDAVMLAGCTGFVITSVLTYFFAVWPYFVFNSTHLISTLVTCSLIGLLPAATLGVIACRRFGLAGGSGFVGGSLTTGIFLYLRLQQVIALKGDRRMPQPEFPDQWVWLLPLAWILASLILTLLVMPKAEFNSTP